MKMKKITLKIIIFLLIIYLLIALLLAIFRRNLLYSPAPATIHSFDEVTFNTNGAKIKTILLNKGKENAILYFGGNAESVVNNAESFNENFKNHSVYLVNYRGYAGSSGEPKESAIYEDALYIYDQLKKKHKNICENIQQKNRKMKKWKTKKEKSGHGSNDKDGGRKRADIRKC